MDCGHAVPGSKRGLPSRKRAIRVTILEFSHPFYAGSLCDLGGALAHRVLYDCGGEEHRDNYTQWNIRHQLESDCVWLFSVVQCFLFHWSCAELLSRVKFVSSELRSRSAAAVAPEHDSRCYQVFVPVSAAVPRLRLRGEKGVLALRPGEEDFCWK